MVHTFELPMNGKTSEPAKSTLAIDPNRPPDALVHIDMVPDTIGFLV